MYPPRRLLQLNFDPKVSRYDRELVFELEPPIMLTKADEVDDEMRRSIKTN